MYALLDFCDSLSCIEPLWTNFGTVHDLMTPITLVGIIHLRHSLLRKVIPGINDPPAQDSSTSITNVTTTGSRLSYK